MDSVEYYESEPDYYEMYVFVFSSKSGHTYENHIGAISGGIKTNWSYVYSKTLGFIPVFDLKENVIINGGNGTAESPYILSI